MTRLGARFTYVNVIYIHTQGSLMTLVAKLDAKLDQWGIGAWIALMVLGFIIWWPLGLATLA